MRDAPDTTIGVGREPKPDVVPVPRVSACHHVVLRAVEICRMIWFAPVVGDFLGAQGPEVVGIGRVIAVGRRVITRLHHRVRVRSKDSTGQHCPSNAIASG